MQQACLPAVPVRSFCMACKQTKSELKNSGLHCRGTATQNIRQKRDCVKQQYGTGNREL